MKLIYLIIAFVTFSSCKTSQSEHDHKFIHSDDQKQLDSKKLDNTDLINRMTQIADKVVGDVERRLELGLDGANICQKQSDDSSWLEKRKKTISNTIYNVENKTSIFYRSNLGAAITDLLKVSALEDAKNEINRIQSEINAKQDKRNAATDYINDPGSREDMNDIAEKLLPNINSIDEAHRKKNELEKDISDLQSEKNTYLSLAASEINSALGSSFTESQIRAFLLNEEGNKFIQAVAIFIEFRPVLDEIKDLDNTSTAYLRKRQGAYLSLLGVLDYAQSLYLESNLEFAEKVVKDIQPGLEDDIKSAQDSIASIRQNCEIIGCSPEKLASDIAKIEASNATREKLLGLSDKYIDYLDAKYNFICSTKMQLWNDLLTAKESYKTYVTAGELFQQIDDGMTLFNQIDALEKPEIEFLTLELEEIEEFEKLLAN